MEYKPSADDAGLKAAAFSTFCILWKKLTPHIMVMKPMTDLCWICQKNSMVIMRSAHTPEAENSQVKKWQLVNIQSYRYSLQVLKDAEAHLLATQERSHYSHAIETAKAVPVH